MTVPSPQGRLLAIGDIHGRARHLETLLEAVAPTDDDRIVFLGDYVNGGNDSAGVLDLVNQIRATFHTVTLLGNHDDEFVNALHTPELFDAWVRLRGAVTVRSYGTGETARAASILARHGGLLDALVLWHEEPEAIFVHGSVDHALQMADQPREILLWQKTNANQPPHVSGKLVVCGHTAQRSGLPGDWGAYICIDTDAKGDQWLTCLDVISRTGWQSRGRDEVRTFAL